MASPPRRTVSVRELMFADRLRSPSRRASGLAGLAAIATIEPMVLIVSNPRKTLRRDGRCIVVTGERVSGAVRYSLIRWLGPRQPVRGRLAGWRRHASARY